MQEQNDTKQIIAENLVRLRKASGLTQSELAERINYTDKSVSKWERGEGVPDVLVLNEIAKIFGVTVNDILGVEAKPEREKPQPKFSKTVVALMSAGLVWVVAVIVYVVLKFALKDNEYLYLTFMYAIPATAIVLLVFSVMCGKRVLNIVFSSIINWGVGVCVMLVVPLEKSWLFLLICIPIQILFILWYFIKPSMCRFLHLKSSSTDAVKTENDGEKK